jgi:hypothetical protein
MEERIINDNIMIPAYNKTAKISQPRKRSLNLIPALITPHLASIIIFLSLVIASVRTNQLNTPLSQTLAKRVAVIALVGNQPLWILSRSAPAFARHRDIVQCFFEERDFVRGRRVQVVSQRNTFAVDHHHPLRSLAAFGLSDAFAPFFAGAKLPSANASDQSNCPFSSSSDRKARHASSQMPFSSQSLSLRQHVEGLEYRFGKSAHGAPVRSTQRMPSNTLRFSAQGLPPRLDFLGFGSNDSIFCHCASVNFHRSLAIEKTPFNSQVYISPYVAQV